MTCSDSNVLSDSSWAATIRMIICYSHVWSFYETVFQTSLLFVLKFVSLYVNYCNSLYYKLPKSQLSRLQQIQNSLARKVLTTTWPPYLHNLISVKRPRSTLSSSVDRYSCSATFLIFSKKSLIAYFVRPMFYLVSGINSLYFFVNLILIPVPSFPTDLFLRPSLLSLLIHHSCSSITPSLFHSRLKTYLFHKSYPRSFTSSSRAAFTDLCPDHFFWATRSTRFSFLVFLIFCFCALC